MQGPVGAPAPTDPNAPETVFQYTTTDINGALTVLTATFTPTFPPTINPVPTPTSQGTILNYSSWLAQVGTNTVPISNAALERWAIAGGAWKVGAGLLAGVVGGAWIVFA